MIMRTIITLYAINKNSNDNNSDKDEGKIVNNL